MNRRIAKIVGLLIVIIVVFTGCKVAPPVLKEIGPAKIKAGQGFNVQATGQSAIWAKTENATKTTVIVWGETQLKTTFGGSDNLTALVPSELYVRSGQVHSTFDRLSGSSISEAWR